MGRVERRMYQRARGRKRLRRVLLLCIVAVIALGVWLRWKGQNGLEMEPVPRPTNTPVTASFDETVETREITLESQTWYAIQTGIYSTRAAAEEKVNLYAQRGAPGYVNQDGDKWRVYIACYGDKDDAAAVRERLSTSQSVETYLHTWACPEITLRLTGMVGQMDVAEAGLMLMHQAANVLRDNAQKLDGGEMTAGEAQEAIAALGESVALWLNTAKARFTAPYPALIQLEIQQAEGWAARQKLLQKAEGATALSAEMKLQAMALFDQSCELRQQLME